MTDLPALEASSYDRWFDSPWGRYAFGVESGALRRGLGSPAGRRVLDVGCGTGRFTAALEKINSSVAGGDLDLAMLTVAAKRVPAPLAVADALHLPFDDATFDASVAVTLCEFTADPALVVDELVRVTRSGGRIVIGALNLCSPWGLVRRRRLRRPPWDVARFLSRRELTALGRTHGRITLEGALLAPGTFPGVERIGPLLLKPLARACPSFGAFQVLVIEVP